MWDDMSKKQRRDAIKEWKVIEPLRRAARTERGIFEIPDDEYNKDPRCSMESHFNETYIFTEDFTCGEYIDYIKLTKEIENKLYEYWIIIASVYIILM